MMCKCRYYPGYPATCVTAGSPTPSTTKVSCVYNQGIKKTDTSPVLECYCCKGPNYGYQG